MARKLKKRKQAPSEDSTNNNNPTTSSSQVSSSSSSSSSSTHKRHKSQHAAPAPRTAADSAARNGSSGTATPKQKKKQKKKKSNKHKTKTKTPDQVKASKLEADESDSDVAMEDASAGSGAAAAGAGVRLGELVPVPSKAGVVRTVLARFPAGIPPELVQERERVMRVVEEDEEEDEQDEDAALMEFDVFCRKKKPLARVFQVKTQAMSLRAKNSAAGSDLHSFAVGVYEPRKQRVGLVDVDTVYQLRKVAVEGLKRRYAGEYAKDKDGALGDDSDDDLVDWETRREQRDNVVEVFGSKKQKRRVRKERSNRVDVMQHLEHTKSTARHLKLSANASGSSAEALSKDINADVHDRYLPPYDLEADDVRQAYPLGSLLPITAWKSLNFREVGIDLNKPKHERDLHGPRKYGRFVTSLFELLETIRDKDRKKGKEQARLMLLIAYLVVLSRSRKYTVEGLRDDDEFPEPLAEWCMTTFGEQSPRAPEVYVRNDVLTSKLYCYICVLALRAANYKLAAEQVELLVADLSTTRKELVRHVRQVGAVTDGRGSKAFKLKAPLKLPSLKRRRG